MYLCTKLNVFYSFRNADSLLPKISPGLAKGVSRVKEDTKRRRTHSEHPKRKRERKKVRMTTAMDHPVKMMTTLLEDRT